MLKRNGSTEDKLSYIESTLTKNGFTLDETQPHISGERSHMSQNKFVLLGCSNKTNKRVVIKCGNTKDVREEIKIEKEIRDKLEELGDVDSNISMPKECYFKKIGSWLFFIIEFIPQEKVFVAHSLKEQFYTILPILEGYEAFHLTTYKHIRKIHNVCTKYTETEYSDDVQNFIKDINNSEINQELKNKLREIETYWNDHKNIINKLGNNLIHTDFVPHNFRIHNKKIYALDFSAVRFGNKYETWARFLNYMTIHNPDLVEKLTSYLHIYGNINDIESLKMMRLYKILFILRHYARTVLSYAENNEKKLTHIRIAFWFNVLMHTLQNELLPSEKHLAYISKRDSLRSLEEKERQREFSIA